MPQELLRLLAADDGAAARTTRGTAKSRVGPAGRPGDPLESDTRRLLIAAGLDPVRIADLVELTRHPKTVAIGEAGLDYHYDLSPREAQERGFRNHIAAARATGLPLVIHSREADADMAAILEQETGKGAFPAVLHCFTGGRDLALRLVSISDIVVENFAGGVMERLGLGYEALRCVKPDVIMASHSLTGLSGPHTLPIEFDAQSTASAKKRIASAL